MKKMIRSLFIVTTGLTIAFVIGNGTANASTFKFSREGWPLGFDENGSLTRGILNGVFSGEDVRGENPEDIKDGIISLDQGEVSFFRMSFQGDSSVDDFEHNFADLFQLEYSLATNELLIRSNNSERGGIHTYDSDNEAKTGLIFQAGTDEAITTNESAIVREVSEPTSWIGFTIFGLGLCIKRSLGKQRNLPR